MMGERTSYIEEAHLVDLSGKTNSELTTIESIYAKTNTCTKNVWNTSETVNIRALVTNPWQV